MIVELESLLSRRFSGDDVNSLLYHVSYDTFRGGLEFASVGTIPCAARTMPTLQPYRVVFPLKLELCLGAL